MRITNKDLEAIVKRLNDNSKNIYQITAYNGNFGVDVHFPFTTGVQKLTSWRGTKKEIYQQLIAIENYNSLESRLGNKTIQEKNILDMFKIPFMSKEHIELMNDFEEIGRILDKLEKLDSS